MGAAGHRRCRSSSRQRLREDTGGCSWTALLDAVRLCPGDDATEVTAVQIRELIYRLIAAG